MLKKIASKEHLKFFGSKQDKGMTPEGFAT